MISLGMSVTLMLTPASGMSWKCSRIRPLSVFGPFRGKWVPRFRLISRNGWLPSTRAPPSRLQCRSDTDNFFENVFLCGQPENFSVFVDDDADTLTVLLEKLQLSEDSSFCGYVIRFLNLCLDFFDIKRTPLQRGNDSAKMQDAHDVSRVIAIDRQACVVAGAQAGHDVFDGKRLKLEEVEQDATVLVRNEIATFQYYCSQFLRC